MSKYINLDDPEVRYYLNFGPAEVYIVPPEAERIDIVRCGECVYAIDDVDDEWIYCQNSGVGMRKSGFCSDGERRTDEID